MVWSFAEKTTFLPSDGGIAFTAADKATILGAMQTAYDGSSTAKTMFDNWIDAGKTIEIKFVPGAFAAYPNTGKLELDLSFLTNNTYITPTGKAVEDTAVTAIVHELGHALTGRRDNGDYVTDYKGENVKFVNQIYQELGLPEQISYIAYDDDGSLHELNFDYTEGATIDRAVSRDSDWNSSAAGNSKDLLIGGPSANTLQSGDGNDFLWGAGGNDSLFGGNGTDTVGFKGKPTDYDLRQNPDGTWTSRHVRGAANEGTDTITNIEKVMFKGGETFNLKKKGLTYQSDFALVIDTTGSMGDDIGAVKTQGTAIINALFADDTKDARIGIVGFKDTTIGEPTSIILPFTEQDQFADRKTAALNALNGITVGGGGDLPETAFDGLLKALNGTMGKWRPGAGVHRVVLFTDAPAKDGSLAATVAALAANIGATITSSSRTVGASGSLDSFTLTPINSNESGRSLSVNPDAEPLPPFEFTDESPTPDTSIANLEIYTIYTGNFGSLDPDLESIASTTGGSSFVAPNPDDLVKTLLTIINLPSITLAVSPESVTEDGTTNLVYTFTRTGVTTDALTVNYTVGGTATFNTDYTQTGAASFTSTTGTVTFAAGSSTATVTIDPTADTNVEDDETVVLTLASGTGYAAGTTEAVVGIITNTDTDTETPSNQAPTDLALSATTVNENVPVNTVIGTFSSTDPDTGNTFTYSLVAGTGDTDNSAFSIVGNQLQINNSPDFETKNSYSILVKTTDQGGLSFEKTLTITVNDLNETPSNQDPNENPSNQAPTNLALSATTVNENVPVNTVIGTFSSTDPDTGNTFTYSLVAGTGDTDNSAFSIVGNQLQINNSPDFETKNSYSIRVKTTDQGGLSFEKTLTITVNDVNENPSNQAPTALIFQNAVTELAENVDVTPEFKVADLLIEDDGLGTNNLFLTGRDRERFLIQNSALFYVGFTPNFEAQNSYEVTVNVDDPTVGVTPDLTQTFTLNITDVNEAPTALILANSTKAIAENTDTSQGVKVADIQISDDALGTNSLSLLGNDQSSFQIRGRELFFIGKADFEAQSLYNLTVAVTDTTLKPAPNATPDATVNFTLGITNLPDQAVNPQTIQFNNTGNGQGSLVFNFSNLPGSIQVKAIEEGLRQTGAFFNNVVGLYPVADDNGAVFDSLDLDGDGNVTELIQASQAGYARTALSQAVNNFILRASGEGANQSTTAAEFGDVLLEGGRRYAPFVIANGGNLGESLQGSIQAFLTKNPDNVAATLENYRTHEVAYFSFGSANPDGAEHLRSRGNNIFGFEDLPGNLPNISDNDFNDGILAFNFIA
ncbi:MAG: cadherin domain-containing protein [Microcystis panniformis]